MEIPLQKMSDCTCSKTADLELNRELLKVFLEDDEIFVGDNKVRNAELTELSNIPQFTVFDEKHMKKAHATAHQLSELDVSEMIEALSDLKNRHPSSSYVDYLSRIALFKHKDTKDMTLPPPSQTIPRAFFCKEHFPTGENNLLGSAAPATLIGSKATLDPENKLDWWRQDPGLSEHHYNWHLYYPYNKPVKDRQGELFAYMHQQMLARYNSERLAVGLSPVEPYGPGIHWDDPLPEGFNPKLEDYSFRASFMSIPDSVTLGSRHILASNMDTNKERLCIAIARNHLEGPTGNRVPLTMDKLGCCVEASTGSANKELYGNLHNNGHVMISLMNDPDGRYNIDPGAMIATETAARDPVFYRWHKFIDTIFEKYRRSSNILSYTKEDLKVRGIEVDAVSIICEHDPGLGPCQDELVDQLFTRMTEKEHTIYKDRKEEVLRTTSLQHLPFTYHFKVCNTREEDATLVFRVFLAPIRYSEDLDQRRNDFVEMDRFVADIDSGAEQTITRSSEQSSVLLPPTLTLQDIRDRKSPDSQAGCGCGWPRNLLVPRGTSAGMCADLYVLATDWKEDAVSPDAHLSGAVAYCGKRGSPYPDKRPMGFPFDREFSFGSLENMVMEVPNSAKTEVKITFLGHEPFYHST